MRSSTSILAQWTLWRHRWVECHCWSVRPLHCLGLPPICKGVADVRWENHKALVCLVGENIRRQPDVASRVFAAVSDMEVRVVCQGASDRTISFLVEESKLEESVQRLHGIFFPQQSQRAIGEGSPLRSVRQVDMAAQATSLRRCYTWRPVGRLFLKRKINCRTWQLSMRLQPPRRAQAR